MQQRYYDPVVGRFYSNDPVGFTPNNPMLFNRYAYANNNPYKFVDPDGRRSLGVYLALRASDKTAEERVEIMTDVANTQLSMATGTLKLTSVGLAFDFVDVSMKIANGEPIDDKLAGMGASEIISMGIQAALEKKLGSGLTELVGGVVGDYVGDRVENSSSSAKNTNENQAENSSLSGPPVIRVDGRVHSAELNAPVDKK